MTIVYFAKRLKILEQKKVKHVHIHIWDLMVKFDIEKLVNQMDHLIRYVKLSKILY